MSDFLLFLMGVVGSLTGALIALALGVKALIVPLARWANRGIAENREQAKILEPQIKELKLRFKGEEQSESILALYKQAGFNPFLPLKAISVLLVQIPVFVGVFTSVNGDARFQGEGLWIIKDVTKPDALIQLFGLPINLLPFVMLLVSVANLLVMRSLQGMQLSQEITGWFISIGFFLILFDQPAALVLYWTFNIVLQWAIDWSLLRRRA
jgi:YidC/Oxa1 family membrane protein insertase